MHWEILIIPLIALGVWIIGTLFKSEDDKTKKGVRGRGNLPGRAPGRRPVTDLDRFLEEARRRREAEDRPKPPPAPPPRGPAARPPLRERPSRPRETPRPVVSTLRKEEVVVVVPAARPTAPPPVAEPVSSPLPVLEMPSPPSPTSTSPRSAPALQQVRSLLSKPQTAAAAFVLREIFDRPLCKRRR